MCEIQRLVLEIFRKSCIHGETIKYSKPNTPFLKCENISGVKGFEQEQRQRKWEGWLREGGEGSVLTKSKSCDK